MHTCLICQSGDTAPLFDLGPQALGNRFLTRRDEPEQTFPFALGQCAQCGLIQILQPAAPTELKAPFDWVRYNEAEAHLDGLVAQICTLPGITERSTIGAVCFKDDSMLTRFQTRGYANVWRIDAQTDLGITDPCAGLETIQSALTPSTATAIASRRGPVDVLIVRHILEHAHNPHAFSQALRNLVKPDGYLVIEVPDCTPALTRGDYTMPWEEHIVYYTPELFSQSLQILGFKVQHAECYPYGNENSLVAIVQASATKPAPLGNDKQTSAIIALGQRYAAGFEPYRQKALAALEAQRQKAGPVALFGAGHLSCAWLNFLHLEHLVDFVVDDHPKKKGLFMPGSRLPIRPSSDLIDQKIRLCLMSLSAESEAKVIAKNQPYVDGGGAFASIFPGKPNTFPA